MPSYTLRSKPFPAYGSDNETLRERGREEVAFALAVQFMAGYPKHTTFRLVFEVEDHGAGMECIVGTADTDLSGPGEFIIV
jgi:hypothetical protein